MEVWLDHPLEVLFKRYIIECYVLLTQTLKTGKLCPKLYFHNSLPYFPWVQNNEIIRIIKKKKKGMQCVFYSKISPFRILVDDLRFPGACSEERPENVGAQGWSPGPEDLWRRKHNHPAISRIEIHGQRDLGTAWLVGRKEVIRLSD